MTEFILMNHNLTGYVPTTATPRTCRPLFDNCRSWRISLTRTITSPRRRHSEANLVVLQIKSNVRSMKERSFAKHHLTVAIRQLQVRWQKHFDLRIVIQRWHRHGASATAAVSLNYEKDGACGGNLEHNKVLAAGWFRWLWRRGTTHISLYVSVQLLLSSWAQIAFWNWEKW